MNDFIKKLELNFDIQISKSANLSIARNTFNTNEEGNIENLSLVDVGLKSLDDLLPVAGSIINLSLENCSVENIDSLKHFHKLKRLNLARNPLSQKSIGKMGFLPSLINLDLSGVDLEILQIAGLTNLKRLILQCMEDKVKGLEELPSVTHLDMRYSVISNLENIPLHENIQSLNLDDNEIHEISYLERYTNLVELNLSGSLIKEIKGLNQLKNLKKLILASSQIEKIEGLDNLKNLELLDLSDNNIEKIEGLDFLHQLKKLNLSENKITRVENLNKLVNLEYLYVEDSEINAFDTSFFHKLKSSCTISIGNNFEEIINTSIIPNHVKFKNQISLPMRYGLTSFDVWSDE